MATSALNYRVKTGNVGKLRRLKTSARSSVSTERSPSINNNVVGDFDNGRDRNF
jgi:hypothetical protein